ncbi:MULTISPECIES: amino acid transporter [unclassified Streptomyces]|uniref:nucleotidyltransferase domain-containing protein n=1 Tax=unclassified Streptomyces TaxID=2593676 RepID=UPI002253C150|nr:amino acid transporter [Streptomyces sp. NBC_01789]MCX4446903.1 amino acid transporter [Streptomyces sp. NBC_01789]
MRTETPWGVWDPPPLDGAVRLLAPLRAPWWISGGYAVELAVGRAYREHADIDVLLLRRDQSEAQRVLAGWEWWAADPPGTLRPWCPGEILPAGVHDIWCRPGPDEPWRLQFMLDDADGEDWVFRRDARVRLPLERLGRVSDGGIPYLATEVQLLYKSKSRRPKDEQDFEAALPVLDDRQRAWLAETITLVEGADHPWAARLRAALAD